MESPYFDTNENQIKVGQVLKRLYRVGTNNRGNGKKLFHKYYIVDSNLNSGVFRYIIIELNKNFRKPENSHYLFKMGADDKKVLKSFEILK